MVIIDGSQHIFNCLVPHDGVGDVINQVTINQCY